MAKAEILETPLVLKAHTLTLPRDAAGHKMISKVPVAYSKTPISEVRAMVIENTDSFETINYIYIITSNMHLKGVVNLKDLLTSDPEKQIGQIAKKKIIKARVGEDAERVAHLAVKNNIKAIPLVDDKDRMLGIMPSDEILAVIAHESRSDLLKSSGIILGKNKLFSGMMTLNPLQAYIRRVPWVLVGLFGGLFMARVISQFEEVLAEHIILASFIPLIAYLANAVGNQSQTLYIRDLATQPKFSMIPYVAKQYATTVLISLTCWSILLGISLLFWGGINIGFIVGLAVTLAVFLATTFALLIPKILDRVGIDPATGSGPFSTVIQDFLSILIYLVTASLLI